MDAQPARPTGTAPCGFRRATRRAALGRSLATLVLAAGLVFDCAAAEPPFDLDDPARIEAGRKRFNKTCAGYCHGAEGVGGRAPDFKGRTDLPPALAFETIYNGREGAEVMPPWGGSFSDAQIWELVAYLQYLGRQPAGR